jgi:hypothetical protein
MASKRLVGNYDGTRSAERGGEHVRNIWTGRTYLLISAPTDLHPYDRAIDTIRRNKLRFRSSLYVDSQRRTSEGAIDGPGRSVKERLASRIIVGAARSETDKPTRCGIDIQVDAEDVAGSLVDHTHHTQARGLDILEVKPLVVGRIDR